MATSPGNWLRDWIRFFRLLLVDYGEKYWDPTLAAFLSLAVLVTAARIKSVVTFHKPI